MTQPTVTIDLGELDRAPVPVPAPALAPRHRRLLAVLAAVLVSMLGLGASGSPPPSLGNPLWTAPVSLAGFSLGTQTAYVSEPGARAVVGRWLSDGRTRWRLDLNQYLDFTSDLGGGLAAVVSHDSRSPLTSTLIDEQTGRVLARHGGVPIGWTAGGLLLLNEYPVSCPDNGPCTVMAAIDARTGAERWRLGPSVEPVWLMDAAGGAVREIATIGKDGTVSTRDPDTGGVLETTAPGAVPLTAQAILVGGTVVTAMPGSNRVLVAGLALGPSGRTWSLPLQLPAIVDEYSVMFGLFHCGHLACLNLGGVTAVIDPVAGALRFWNDLEILDSFAGDTLIAAPAVRERTQPREIRILDALSGRTIRTVAGSPIEWVDSGGRIMLMREASGRTAFTVVEPDGRAQPIGSVPGTGLDCRATGSTLACSEPAGTLRAWRLPSLVDGD